MRHPVDIRRFRPQTAGHRKLPIVVPSPVRMAQVSSPAALFAGVRYFSHTQEAELQEYGPQVLLGSAEDLLQLAERVRRRFLDLRKLDRTIFVLTDCRDMPLRDTVRVIFWQAFGVPAYELLLGGDGSLLAAECEAFEG